MRTIRTFLPLIAIAAVLAACSGSSSSVLRTDGGTTDGSTGGQPPANGAAEPMPAASAAAIAANGGPIAAIDDTKIIRTGTMSLEVSDLATALRTARDGIVGLGGYIGASTTGNEGDKPSAEITYRIPADKWETALDLLHGLGGLTTKVVSEHTEAVEVTGQVVDLEANIANLRASEIALQGIAEKATKISDVLEVQAQLTTTRGQIETLTAQLKDLNDRSAYASMMVDYNVPVVAVEVAGKGWDPGAVVDEAAATMVSVLQNIATAAIWFVIVWLPIFLVLGAVTLIAIWIARRFGARRGTPVAPPPPAPVTEG